MIEKLKPDQIAVSDSQEKICKAAREAKAKADKALSEQNLQDQADKAKQAAAKKLEEIPNTITAIKENLNKDVGKTSTDTVNSLNSDFSIKDIINFKINNQTIPGMDKLTILINELNNIKTSKVSETNPSLTKSPTLPPKIKDDIIDIVEDVMVISMSLPLLILNELISILPGLNTLSTPITNSINFIQNAPGKIKSSIEGKMKQLMAEIDSLQFPSAPSDPPEIPTGVICSKHAEKVKSEKTD